jgi:hypothetical protein
MHFGDFADVALSAILKSSQVQTIVDYAKLSPSSDQPIVLALKKFIPCYAAELCIKTPSALLAAWIESNILPPPQAVCCSRGISVTDARSRKSEAHCFFFHGRDSVLNRSEF